MLAVQAYNILELYLELFSVRSHLISKTKEIPRDLTEAVASVIYAARVRQGRACAADGVQAVVGQGALGQGCPCGPWDPRRSCRFHKRLLWGGGGTAGGA